ncbi:MAG TPA: nucleotidyl transferase AbiEii/AbiGii toxin family protein [Phycisphaerae bacterium]|jgi:hypothetical protein|nr:nucleotidyl transferase AbiEii/AbiGii toxin family protein [Phycisphaerae bacterium]
MVNSRTDYSEQATAAAHMVMLELVRILGEYRDDLVLVGGWVPELLFSQANPRHVGSTDVDLAINHRTIDAEKYRTILEHLQKQGYVEGNQPFIYFRTVRVNGQQVTVQVDLLSGEYGGTGRSRRHQKVQDIRARKVRGCDLAFALSEEVTVEGELPMGGKDRVRVKVAGVVPFIVMKAMALAERLKAKDAWDIYFCLRNFPGGNAALAEEFRPHVGQKVVREGLSKIREKFISPECPAPISDAT